MDGIKIVVEQIPDVEARVLSAAFLTAVLRFYEDSENSAGFIQWLTEQGGGEENGQEDGSNAPAGIPEPRAGQDRGAASRRVREAARPTGS